jgi:phage tail-like protein
MRALAPDLATAHPLGAALPALYQDDDFAQRLTQAFDAVLSPIFSVLDNGAAYIDPRHAPHDFQAWLAGWMAVALDADWPPARRRELLLHAVELHRWRGTARGMRREIALLTGVEPEILEGGGVVWSTTPQPRLPDSPDGGRVTVRLRVADPEAVDRARLERLVADVKPAHLGHTVEVVPS